MIKFKCNPLTVFRKTAFLLGESGFFGFYVLTSVKISLPVLLSKTGQTSSLLYYSRYKWFAKLDMQKDKCNLMFANTFSLKRYMQTIHKVNSGSVGSKNGKNQNNYSCNK